MPNILKQSGRKRKMGDFMLSKILVLLISIQLIVLPVAARADTGTTTGRVTNLQKGQKAPYAGVLLDPVAASKMIVNERFIRLETELRLRKEFSLDLSRKALAFDLLKTEHDALRNIHLQTLKIKEKQIADLNTLLRKQASSDNTEWWLAGGVVVGIVLSIAVFYASVEVAK